MSNFIVVTSEVPSGGKTTCAASLALLLKDRGISVQYIKLASYLDLDASKLDPGRHGEVFITEDGAITDRDLGEYERFTGDAAGAKNYVTMGQIYVSVMAQGRQGKYCGDPARKDQVIEEIKRRIQELTSSSSVVIVEVGGAVGDKENELFLEAMRQMRVSGEKVLYLHLPLSSGATREATTRPGVRILADAILCRHNSMSSLLREEIARFYGVEDKAVFSIPAADTISSYEVPLRLREAKLDEYLIQELGLLAGRPGDGSYLERMGKIVEMVKRANSQLVVGFVCKHTGSEAYHSVKEALRLAGWYYRVNVAVKEIDATRQDLDLAEELEGVAGIVVPDGFGYEGIENKVLAASYALQQDKPYLGTCLGLQVLVIAYARWLLGLEDANSEEFDSETQDPVICQVDNNGKRRRLGDRVVKLVPGTAICNEVYGGELEIVRRHHHGYRVNPRYLECLQNAGLIISGYAEDKDGPVSVFVVETVEVKGKRCKAVQFHPEFGRGVDPLFLDFIRKCLTQADASLVSGLMGNGIR